MAEAHGPLVLIGRLVRASEQEVDVPHCHVQRRPDRWPTRKLFVDPPGTGIEQLASSDGIRRPYSGFRCLEETHQEA